MINNNTVFQLISAETRWTELFVSVTMWLRDYEVTLIATFNNTSCLNPPDVVLSTTGGSKEQFYHNIQQQNQFLYHTQFKVDAAQSLRQGVGGGGGLHSFFQMHSAEMNEACGRIAFWPHHRCPKYRWVLHDGQDWRRVEARIQPKSNKSKKGVQMLPSESHQRWEEFIVEKNIHCWFSNEKEKEKSCLCFMNHFPLYGFFKMKPIGVSLGTFALYSRLSQWVSNFQDRELSVFDTIEPPGRKPAEAVKSRRHASLKGGERGEGTDVLLLPGQ